MVDSFAMFHQIATVRKRLGLGRKYWVCGLAAVGAGVCPCPAQSIAGDEVTITIEQLMDRIVERDPGLAQLRREVLEAELDIERAYPWDEPEVRLRYGNASRAAVPDPYQEVRQETITQRGSTLAERTGTGVERVTERRDDISPTPGDPRQPSASESIEASSSFVERERESRNFAETTTRTTIRDVTPGSRSTVIRERTVETVREDYTQRADLAEGVRGVETRTPDRPVNLPAGADPLDFVPTRFTADTQSREQRADQGQERTQLVEERVEEQSYGYDPYEGSEDYEVELRFRPPHPWEMKARRERARADAAGAAFALESAERALRLEVQALYLELQFADRELALLRRGEEWVARELALSRELLAAGETTLGEMADLEVAAFKARRDRTAREAEFLRGRDALAARAGLPQPEVLQVSGPLAVPVYRPEELQLERLLPVAMDLHQGLGMLAALQRGLREEMAIVRSQRIPWFSLVSASYTYETRYSGKYRDEYDILVGVEIPIFAWFQKDDRLLTRQLEWAQEDEQIAEERMRLELERGIARLRQRVAADREERAEHEALRARLEQGLQDLPEANLTARRERLTLQRALLDLEERALELEQDRALETLALEFVLGARLAEVMGPADEESASVPGAEGPQG
jgi:outer membrane protein TolC